MSKPTTSLASVPEGADDDAPSVPSALVRTRTLMGRFVLGRRLGAGASGTVYEAFDEKHKARVALKVLNASTGDPLVRFKREFRALQNVRHPNIVSFGELFCDADEWFFTMDLLEGVDFRAYVRRGGRFDEARVRDALRQLADALVTLHAAGIVHRDVKPANVVVSVTGHVTLLDFGVVKDDTTSGATDEHVSFVGTPAFMAPEQIMGDAGPAADCYAVGVMLFDALVGKLPYGGKIAQVLRAKRSEPPPEPHALAAGVPRDLSQLAVDLLAMTPDARPSAQAIALRISPSRRLSASAPAIARPPDFVGRDAELAELGDALRATKGQPIAVLVEGESGIGKSALVQHFIGTIRAREPNALVLSSRCRETEWIPYKAFDGLLEGLSRFMRMLGEAQVAQLLPLHAALVAKVFPTLMQVAAVALAPASVPFDADVVRQRRRLFAAVRDLLARVAQRHTLVLFIDDLQWADPDSLALLSEVLRGPDAPPLLLLATARDDAQLQPDAGDATRRAIPAWLRAARRVRVGPLAYLEAKNLARILAGPSEAGRALDTAAIARETEGHPLFIQELVCHAAANAGSTGAIRFDDALAARIDALDSAAREVVECVALAARPITRGLVARATALDGNDTYRRINLLCAANLVRMSGPQAEAIEPFHDRVRQAILDRLPPARRTKRHRRIAAALESLDGKDNEALAYHWREAGKSDRAATYAEAAAADAEHALAFDQAAQHYRMALDVGEPALGRRVLILTKLGDALANAGRGAASAGAYREAASHATGSEAVSCLQKAADQLFRAGQIEQGLALAHEVLATLGLRIPEARWHLLWCFFVWRCILAVRGLAFRERSAAEILPRELARIDASWSITGALSTVDPIRGAYFQARHLRMALRAGEPYRVVRALALQIGYAAGPGRGTSLPSDRLTARCRELSARIGNPHALALTQMSAGIASYLHGRYARSLELLDDAEQRLASCPGAWGEIARARLFALSSLASLGKMRELRVRLYAHLRDAREHGDVHATTNLRIGYPSLVWLMEDDVEGARAELADAMAEWALPGFQIEHFYELFASTNVDLYAGEAPRARARQLEAWPRLERSYLLRIPAARALATSTRARTAIAVAAGASAPSERDALLAEAAHLAKRVAREPLPFAAATSLLLRAGIAAVRERAAEATTQLQAAEQAFEARGMMLLAAAARRRRGELTGGDAGNRLVRDASEWMRSEAIVSPEKMTATFAPG